MSTKPSTEQRRTILALLRQAEWPTDFISFLFRRIRVEDKWQGRPVSEWIDAMSATEASAVIKQLQGIVA